MMETSFIVRTYMTLLRVIVPSQAICLTKSGPRCIEKPLVVSDNASKLVCFIMYLRRQKLTFFGKKLESFYERKTTQNKAFVIRKLAHLKLKEGRSFAEHLSEF